MNGLKSRSARSGKWHLPGRKYDPSSPLTAKQGTCVYVGEKTGGNEQRERGRERQNLQLHLENQVKT